METCQSGRMDFTANEGSGLNSTGGSNPPVSALMMSPDIGNTPDLRSGVFRVPGLAPVPARHLRPLP